MRAQKEHMHSFWDKWRHIRRDGENIAKKSEGAATEVLNEVEDQAVFHQRVLSFRVKDRYIL